MSEKTTTTTTINAATRIAIPAALLEAQYHITKDSITGEKKAVANVIRKKDFGTAADVYVAYKRYMDVLYIASYKRLKAPDDNTKAAEKTALDNLFQFLHTSVCGTPKQEIFSREYGDYCTIIRATIAPDKATKTTALEANDVSALRAEYKLTPAAVETAARREYALHNARTALKFADCNERVLARVAKIIEAGKAAEQADKNKF